MRFGLSAIEKRDTQGRFFTPNLRPWRGGGTRVNIEKIVVGCGGLKGITSEKGDTGGWVASSVFGNRRQEQGI
jgi:hypothetical protein